MNYSISTSPEIQEFSGIWGVFKDNFENLKSSGIFSGCTVNYIIAMQYLLHGIPWNSLCDMCLGGYGLQIVAFALHIFYLFFI